MSCPICRKPSDAAYKPFCSRRCADVDLARWLRADYVIPTPLVPDPDRGADDPKNDEG